MAEDGVVFQLRESLSTEGLELTEQEERLLNECTAWPGALVQLASSILAAKRTERAVRVHAEALGRAAEGSERYAGQLAKATWALVGVTGLLVMATLLSLFGG